MKIVRHLTAIALLAWTGCGLEDVELTRDSGAAAGDAADAADAAADAIECGECELPGTCEPAPDGTACSLGACFGIA